MRDDTNIHCHGLKGNASHKTRSKRDGDDSKTMRDCSKFRKVVFYLNFFKIYRHIVTLGRKVNVRLIISRDDKRDDTRFIVAKQTLSSRFKHICKLFKFFITFTKLDAATKIFKAIERVPTASGKVLWLFLID
jgi:hypothetical protein